MSKTLGYYAPPGCIWGPWIVLPGTAVFSTTGKPFKQTIQVSSVGDNLALCEVQYFAPGGKKSTVSFTDSITITRDGGSADEVKIRMKNTLPTGCAHNVTY